MTAPLDGVVVVSLEQAVAGPLATRHLADLGATVLKVERPDGGDFARSYNTDAGGESTFFVWANRGKQSIALDIKDPDDRAVFDALVAGADVFVQNLSLRAAAAAGVRAQQLSERHPRLIACEVSGYGEGGPRSDDKAYDLAIQAEAGAIALTGSATEMSKVGFSAADIASAMYAFSSILAALYRRATTGEGASISISMLEALTEWTAPPIYASAFTGVTPERAGHRHAAIAPYGLYPLADGAQVMIAVQSNRDWATFVREVLRDESLVDDARFRDNSDRITNVDALEAVVGAVFSSQPAEEIVRRLSSSGVVWARAREPMEVWRHEQHLARDRFITTRLPSADIPTFRPPFNIAGCPDPPASVPALDEHDPATVARVVARSTAAEDASADSTST